MRRDLAADGVFFYSVRTTGVYCRPACAARLPRRENVAFHASCRRPRRRASARASAAGRTSRRSPSARRRRWRGLSPDRGGRRGAEPRRAGRGRRPEPLPLPPRVQGGHRRDAEGLCRRASRPARAGRARAARDGDRGDLRRRLQLQRPLLCRRDRAARHDAERVPRRRRRSRRSASRSANARSARSSSRRPSKGVCAIHFGDDPDALVRDLQDRFPKARLVGGDEGFEQLVAQVVGLVEAPAHGLDLPLDVRGTAFQQRVWQALREIPMRVDRDLCRDRRAHRRAQGGAGGRAGLRGQPDRGRHPVPPRGAHRRRAVGLPLGRRAQARPARAGGGGMTLGELGASPDVDSARSAIAGAVPATVRIRARSAAGDAGRRARREVGAATRAARAGDPGRTGGDRGRNAGARARRRRPGPRAAWRSASRGAPRSRARPSPPRSSASAARAARATLDNWHVRSSCGSGGRCADPGRLDGGYGETPNGSARPRKRMRSARHARRMSSPSRFRATASCARTAAAGYRWGFVRKQALSSGSADHDRRRPTRSARAPRRSSKRARRARLAADRRGA